MLSLIAVLETGGGCAGLDDDGAQPGAPPEAEHGRPERQEEEFSWCFHSAKIHRNGWLDSSWYGAMGGRSPEDDACGWALRVSV
jgi:hypothetical protein